MEIKSTDQPIKVEVVRKWYKTWWGILGIILVPYILLPLIFWKYTNWSKGWKIASSALVMLFFIFLLAGLSSESSQPTQNSPDTQTAQQESSTSTISQKDLMKQNSPNVKQLATLTADYVGKSFTLYVNVESTNYYNYGFRDENKYYSVRLWDDSAEDVFDRVYGYLDKSKPENRSLVNRLLNEPAFLKLNASIPVEKYEQSSNAFLQIDS
ncbi:MAG TPA: hypothetical protein VF303_00915, partial [Candidatus Nanoarchaeia archaeon]